MSTDFICPRCNGYGYLTQFDETELPTEKTCDYCHGKPFKEPSSDYIVFGKEEFKKHQKAMAEALRALKNAIKKDKQRLDKLEKDLST